MSKLDYVDDDLVYKKTTSNGGRVSYKSIGTVGENMWSDFKPYGCYLTVTKPNTSSTKYGVEPALAPMVAATLILRDRLVDIIHEASAFASPYPIMNAKQKAAWDNMGKVFGGLTSIHSASMHDIAAKILDAIAEEATQTLTTPAAKEAYEQFLLVAALSKDHSTIEN